MKARFIYRDGKFWFRSTALDLNRRGFFHRHYQAGPFATLRAAWDARFGG